MKITFTYPLPDSLYFPEVSGNKTAEYTYEGPEILTVVINPLGEVIEVDPHSLVEVPLPLIKYVNASERPEIAYMILKNDIDHIPEPSEPEILHNGDSYIEPKNPFLWIAYDLIFDMEKDDWDLKVLTKPLQNFAKDIAEERLSYLESYYTQYAFSDEINSLMESTISELKEFIDTCTVYPLWKYTNLDFVDQSLAPKIPFALVKELQSINVGG